MKNPQLYIFIAISFSILLNWVTSRFSDLSIGLFNTAIGLLFGVTANLALNMTGLHSPERNPALMDIAWLLALFQFASGILVISSHFAADRINRASITSHNMLNLRILEIDLFQLKEALFYAFSVTLSFGNCYAMGLLLLNASQIFAPIDEAEGALQVLLLRFAGSSSLDASYWLLLLGIVFAFRYFRQIMATRVRL